MKGKSWEKVWDGMQNINLDYALSEQISIYAYIHIGVMKLKSAGCGYWSIGHVSTWDFFFQIVCSY